MSEQNQPEGPQSQENTQIKNDSSQQVNQNHNYANEKEVKPNDQDHSPVSNNQVNTAGNNFASNYSNKNLMPTENIPYNQQPINRLNYFSGNNSQLQRKPTPTYMVGAGPAGYIQGHQQRLYQRQQAALTDDQDGKYNDDESLRIENTDKHHHHDKKKSQASRQLVGQHSSTELNNEERSSQNAQKVQSRELVKHENSPTAFPRDRPYGQIMNSFKISSQQPQEMESNIEIKIEVDQLGSKSQNVHNANYSGRDDRGPFIPDGKEPIYNRRINQRSQSKNTPPKLANSPSDDNNLEQSYPLRQNDLSNIQEQHSNSQPEMSGMMNQSNTLQPQDDNINFQDAHNSSQNGKKSPQQARLQNPNSMIDVVNQIPHRDNHNSQFLMGLNNLNQEMKEGRNIDRAANPPVYLSEEGMNILNPKHHDEEEQVLGGYHSPPDISPGEIKENHDHNFNLRKIEQFEQYERNDSDDKKFDPEGSSQHSSNNQSKSEQSPNQASKENQNADNKLLQEDMNLIDAQEHSNTQNHLSEYFNKNDEHFEDNGYDKLNRRDDFNPHQPMDAQHNNPGGPADLMDQMFDDNMEYANKNFYDDVNSIESIDNTLAQIEFDWNPPETFRAKLYNLDNDGRWHDLGTGHFSIIYTPEGYKMKLIQEQNNSIDLLENDYINSAHMLFQRQRDTIITWSYYHNKMVDSDLAVSFQNNAGAQYTWQKICQILGMDPEHNIEDSQVQEEDEIFSQVTVELIPKMAEELRNTNQIENQQKHEIADRLLQNDCQSLQKLGEMFDEIDAQLLGGDIVDGCHQQFLNLFYIYKGLIQLNDQRLINELLSNRFYLQTFGALEWDPDSLIPIPTIIIHSPHQEAKENINEQPKIDNADTDGNQAQDQPSNNPQKEQSQENVQAEEQSQQEEDSGRNETNEAINQNNKKAEESNNVENDNQANTKNDEDKENDGEQQNEQDNEQVQADQDKQPNDCNSQQETNEPVPAEESNQKEDQPNQKQQPSIEATEKKEGSTSMDLTQEVSNKSNQTAEAQAESQPHYQNQSAAVDKSNPPQSPAKENCMDDAHNEGPQACLQHIDRHKKTLNYRRFLLGEVRFKYIVDLAPQNRRQGRYYDDRSYDHPKDPLENDKYDTLENEGIEDKIHKNYRLQFLRDSVMASYIDDQTVNVINQLITQNNRDIVSYIFEHNEERSDKGLLGGPKQKVSIKDQIIEKIICKNDMKGRHMAIEFIIELCQILKSLQFQPGGVGGPGAANFIYGQVGMGGMNSRLLYEQLNQVNFISLLGETFGIFVPNQNTLFAHLDAQSDSYIEQLVDTYSYMHKGEAGMDESTIRELIEFKIDRNQSKEEQKINYLDSITRIDQMKINTMEIILSFQQNFHMPMSSINKFLICSDQHSKGYPFMKQLVSHLIYSSEQGLKIQISDFLKQIFDGEQNQINNIGIKEIFYQNIIFGDAIDFLKRIQQNQSFVQRAQSAEYSDQVKAQVSKHLEMSAYLLLQILNKVVAEHRYPFTVSIQKYHVITVVAGLYKLNSKIINIEIIKFYKSLLKSKNFLYLQNIMRSNLFDTVYKIFESAYHPKNPPMIISCIRDLFDMIFGRNSEQDNEFHNQKFIDYLKWHKLSQQVFSNDKYSDIFGKYEHILRPEEPPLDCKQMLDHDSIHDAHNCSGPDGGSLSSSPISEYTDQLLNIKKDNHLTPRNSLKNDQSKESLMKEDNVLFKTRPKAYKQDKAMKQQIMKLFDDDFDKFGHEYEQDFYYYNNPNFINNQNESIQNRNQHFGMDQLGGKVNSKGDQYDSIGKEDGNLSPIGNGNFISNEDLENIDPKQEKIKRAQQGEQIEDTSEFLFELENDIKEDKFSQEKYCKANDDRRQFKSQLIIELDELEDQNKKPKQSDEDNENSQKQPDNVNENGGEILDYDAEEENDEDHNQKGYQALMSDEKPDHVKQQQRQFELKVKEKRDKAEAKRQADKGRTNSIERIGRLGLNKRDLQPDIQLGEEERGTRSLGSPQSAPSQDQPNEAPYHRSTSSGSIFKTAVLQAHLPQKASYVHSSDKIGRKAEQSPQQQQCNEIYEKFSNSSSERAFSLEEDIAKDMGIFNLDLNQQMPKSQPCNFSANAQESNSISGGEQYANNLQEPIASKRRRSFDDQELDNKPKSSNVYSDALNKYRKSQTQKNLPPNEKASGNFAGSFFQNGYQNKTNQSNMLYGNTFMSNSVFRRSQMGSAGKSGRLFPETSINRGSSSRDLKDKSINEPIQRQGTKSAEKIIHHGTDDNQKIKLSDITSKSSPCSISAQKLEIESPSPESNNILEIKQTNQQNVNYQEIQKIPINEKERDAENNNEVIKVGQKRSIDTHTGTIQNNEQPSQFNIDNQQTQQQIQATSNNVQPIDDIEKQEQNEQNNENFNQQNKRIKTHHENDQSQ